LKYNTKDVLEYCGNPFVSDSKAICPLHQLWAALLHFTCGATKGGPPSKPKYKRKTDSEPVP